MDFTVYTVATGLVVRSGTVTRASDATLQAAEGEAVLVDVKGKQGDLVVNGVLQPQAG